MNRGCSRIKNAPDRNYHFYWQRVMCKFGLPWFVISENEFQFSSIRVVDLCHDLGVKTNFILVVHQQGNGQTEYANKVIWKRIKKKLDDAKGLWATQLHDM